MNCFNPYSPGFSIYLIQDLEEMVLGADASILIHLDFLSIYKEDKGRGKLLSCFNPYSPGFSIYLINMGVDFNYGIELQSLFTWIFYLFTKKALIWYGIFIASILIHLDFLSI